MNKKIDGLLTSLLINSDNKNKLNSIVSDLEKEIYEIEKVKNNAYKERNELVSLISKLFPSYIASHPEDDLEWEEDWRNIVFIDLPTGQASWHIHDSDFGIFKHLPIGKNCWDGHTTDDKYKRIRRFKPWIK